MSDHRLRGSWKTLLSRSQEIVIHAESKASGAIMNPVLGGGTRLMLALEHRISDDIDVFIRDPQWIGYITPRLNDTVAAEVSSYEEDSGYIKLLYPQGEVDFIVGMSLLGLPPQSSFDSPFPLEDVSEVIAKKLFYRGHSLTVRDVFDWWACAHLPFRQDISVYDGPRIGALLRGSPQEEALSRSLESLVLRAAGGSLPAWDELRTPYPVRLQEVLGWAMGTVASWSSRATPASTPRP